MVVHSAAARCVEAVLHSVEEALIVAGVLRYAVVFLLAVAEHCVLVVRRLAWVIRYVVPDGTARRVRDCGLVFHSNPSLVRLKIQRGWVALYHH